MASEFSCHPTGMTKFTRHQMALMILVVVDGSNPFSIAIYNCQMATKCFLVV
jgi:hypothetical protein